MKAKLVKDNLSEYGIGSDMDYYGSNKGMQGDPRNLEPESDNLMEFEYETNKEGTDLIVTFTETESGRTHKISWSEVIEGIDESDKAWERYVEPVYSELSGYDGQLSEEIIENLIDPMCIRYIEILTQ